MTNPLENPSDTAQDAVHIAQDLLLLQSRLTAILRGKLSIHDPRRLRLCRSLIAASIRELEYSLFEPRLLDRPLDLRLSE